MKSTKTIALVAFTSLGLNVFLGGVLVGKMMRSEDSEVPTTESSTGSASAENVQAPPHRQELRPHHEEHDAHHRGAHPHARGHSADREGGPPDLALLRRMIRVMGGPADPRIARLREERKDEIVRIRREMSAAHKRVHEALTAEKPDDAQLREALKNLRKTAFEAQARAQEGILTLAELMTDEERTRLRHDAPDDKRRKKSGPPPSAEKPSP